MFVTHVLQNCNEEACEKIIEPEELINSGNINDENETIEEFSTSAGIAGYALPLGMSNNVSQINKQTRIYDKKNKKRNRLNQFNSTNTNNNKTK